MNKTLGERLRAANAELAKVQTVLAKRAGAGKVSADVLAQFNELTAFEADVEAWLTILVARAAASS